MDDEKKWWSWSWADALQRGNFAAIADWFSARFFAVGGLGVVFVAIAAWSEQTIAVGLRIATLSLMFAGACTICGWVLGLLFGVPRTLARPTAPAPAPAAPAAGTAAASSAAASAANPSSRVNTNLEDVSDWLTKTLIGVGLTQLLAAPHFIWSAAGKINALGFGWTPYGQLLAVALFFYFTPGGFWLGYIGTRTILTKLFDWIDGPPADSVAVAGKSELKLDLSTQGIASGSATVAHADRTLLAIPLRSLTTPEEFAAWGAAQARSGNLTAAQTALEEANRAAPQNQAIRQQLATIYTAQGRRGEAEQLTTNGGGISDVALLNALYEPRPQGFTKAIEIGRQLVQKPGADRNANLHIWLACAYGQKYSYVKQQNADDPTLPDIKTAAVAEVKAAIDANPASRDLLRSVWKPAPGAEDNDLTGFGPDDADLKALLEPGG